MLTMLATWLSRQPRCFSVKLRAMSSSAATKADTKDGHNLKQFVEDLQSCVPQVTMSSLNQNRCPMEPFAKNLFLGKVDMVVFSYPDVLQNDRYFAVLERCRELQEAIKAREKDLANCITKERRVHKDILLALRSQGIYGLTAPGQDGSEGLSVTEILKLLEELASHDLSLAESVALPATVGYRAVMKFGTDAQKQRYLARLTSGQWIGTICLNEQGSSLDPLSSKTKALFLAGENKYLLNGTKTGVVNGPSADLFTVFAMVDGSGLQYTQLNEGTIGCFLVEKDMPGVTVHRDAVDRKIGLHGLESCSVSFKDVKLSPEQCVHSPEEGVVVLLDLLSNHRLHTSVRMLAAARKLFNQTVEHTLRSQRYGQDQSASAVIQERLAECAAHIYALESTIYMTAGLADYQLHPDVCLEGAICKYTANKVVRLVCDVCADVLGPTILSADNGASQLISDLMMYRHWDCSNDQLASYIALTGLIHIGPMLEKELTQLRKPFEYPYRVLKNFFLRTFGYPMRPTSLHLEHYVHLELIQAAKQLNLLVHHFSECMKGLLLRDGYNAVTAEAEFRLIADLASQMYVLISSMSRASRSYCDGHPHGDHEVCLAISYATLVYHHTQSSLMEFSKLRAVRNKSMCLAGMYTVQQGRFAPTHPITKNVF